MTADLALAGAAIATLGTLAAACLLLEYLAAVTRRRRLDPEVER